MRSHLKEMPARRNTSSWTAVLAWRSVGLLAVLAGVAFFILDGPLFSQTIALIQRYLSSDHHIAAQTVATIHKELMIYGALLLAAGIPITIWADAFSKTISRLVASFRNLTSRRFSIALLCGSFLTGLVLVISWYLRESPGIRGLYGEDRFLETATAVLFVCSAALLVVAAIRHRRRPIAHLNVVAALIAALGVVLFVMGMEEISWGQRLFHWATPAALQQVNDQGETNIHNISNALLAPLYRWGTVALMVLIAASWLWVGRRSKTVLRFLVPHVATLGILVPIFVFGVVHLYGELLEELGAAFAFFYALAVLRTSRHPIYTE